MSRSEASPLRPAAPRRRAAIVSLMFIAGSGCSRGREESAHTVSGRIEEARFIELGGIDQWITIRGEDADNPVLLLVHGGPGDVQSPLVSTYAPYERDFVLVQWDQRGAGRTWGRYGDQTPNLTLPQLVSDGIELAEYLHVRFPNARLILLGHSWGSAIATEMAQRRPDLFSAYVGTGQIASWEAAVQWQFDFLKSMAQQENDTAILEQLETIGKPDPANAEQYFGFTRSLRQHFSPADSAWLAGLRGLAGEMPASDLDALVGGMTLSGRAMLPYQMQTDLAATARNFELPWYVIQGRDDIATPTAPVEAYFRSVAAPRKRLVIIEGAGHFALVTHQEQFIAALRDVLALQ